MIRVAGWASVFDAKDAAGDIARRGAYHESLLKHSEAGVPIVMLRDHKVDKIVGVWDVVEERNGIGLWAEGRVFEDTKFGRIVQAGAVNGLSIGYKAVEAARREEYRELLKIDLWEISIVPFPCGFECRFKVIKPKVKKTAQSQIIEGLRKPVRSEQHQADSEDGYL